MIFKLIPKYNYSLNFFSYLKVITPKNKQLLSYFLNSNVLYMNTARAGLRILLSSCSNHKVTVGVQAFTCHSVFQAIYKAGHNIVFIDLNNDFTLNLEDLKKKVISIDILIITHTFGFPDNVDEIKKICKDKILIEDCSHSFLSKYNDSYTGTLCDASIFSFGFGKFPPVGYGGLCIINNIEKFPLFNSVTKQIHKESIIYILKIYFKALLMPILFNSFIYGIFSYSLGKKLDFKYDILEKFRWREALGSKLFYNILINNSSHYLKIKLVNHHNSQKLRTLIHLNNYLSHSTQSSPNYYLFPILTKNRDQIYEELLLSSIESGKHFAKSITWAKKYGYNGDCPNTEKIINQILILPIHSKIHNKNLKEIAKSIEKNGR